MTEDLPDNRQPAAGDPPPEEPQPTRRCAVRRYAEGHFTALDDQVVAEARVELVVNDDELRMALLCLPRQLTELAVGFLRGEGALRSRGEVERVDIDRAGRTVRVRGRFDPDALDAIHRRWTWGTGCGGGGAPAERPAFHGAGDRRVFFPSPTEPYLKALLKLGFAAAFSRPGFPCRCRAWRP